MKNDRRLDLFFSPLAEFDSAAAIVGNTAGAGAGLRLGADAAAVAAAAPSSSGAKGGDGEGFREPMGEGEVNGCV